MKKIIDGNLVESTTTKAIEFYDNVIDVSLVRIIFIVTFIIDSKSIEVTNLTKHLPIFIRDGLEIIETEINKRYWLILVVLLIIVSVLFIGKYVWFDCIPKLKNKYGWKLKRLDEIKLIKELEYRNGTIIKHGYLVVHKNIINLTSWMMTNVWVFYYMITILNENQIEGLRNYILLILNIFLTIITIFQRLNSDKIKFKDYNHYNKKFISQDINRRYKTLAYKENNDSEYLLVTDSLISKTIYYLLESNKEYGLIKEGTMGKNVELNVKYHSTNLDDVKYVFEEIEV